MLISCYLFLLILEKLTDVIDNEVVKKMCIMNYPKKFNAIQTTDPSDVI